ncbi:MAG: hypothetical protein A2086_03570 [Spirochaetes bacterium GWD1_27_9]|nr:MAG: hypothetical protein A2Z98_09460 [Spirochaetes bacterium GWB1_27_13]OHD31134.1 MAG: hypothetical protein A2086_03570 [Spirochaetes bacterium GWD1_27_9]
MAFRNTADIKKIVLLILLIIVLIGAGILIVDFVGTIFGVQVPIPGLNYIKSVSFRKKLKQSEDPYLLEREELSKVSEKLSIKEEQILNREKEVSTKELESTKKLEALVEREKELNKRQKMMDDVDKQYKDRKQNIREQAVKLYNMPPKDAVALLEKQTEGDIVDILREIDKYSEEIGRQSTSPYLLKLMGDINKDKAASVLRKLKYSIGENSSSVETIKDNQDEIPPP